MFADKAVVQDFNVLHDKYFGTQKLHVNFEHDGNKSAKSSCSRKCKYLLYYFNEFSQSNDALSSMFSEMHLFDLCLFDYQRCSIMAALVVY